MIHKKYKRRNIRVMSLIIVSALLPILSSCSSNPSSQSPSSVSSAQASETLDISSNWPEVKLVAAKDYIKDCKKDLKLANQQFEDIKSGKWGSGDRDLMNALNQLEIVIDRIAGQASLYRNVHPDEGFRKAADVCQQKVYSLVSIISLSRPVYEQIKKINIDSLSGVDKRYAMDTLEDFKRSGVDKDEETRAKIKALNEELLKIGQEFNKNIRESRSSIWVEPSRLAGLPQDFIDAKEPNEKGQVEISTDYPDYIPVLQYAHDDELKKQLYILFRNRAYPANKDVLTQLIQKRHELANILGYKNFAEFVTDDKMVESAENAQNFIDKINNIAKARAAQDYDVLLSRLKKIDSQAQSVGDWQKTYLENLIRSEVYEVDAQEVRQYFSYGNVRAGIFSLVEDLFGVEIKPWDTEVWHPSVEAYELYDDGQLLGQFYLDMHPRKGKYNHAAAFGVREGVEGIQTPISALVCNFPGEKDETELMEHDQVETFLHEFGHLIHGIFGGHQPWLGLSGISTERDFVEAPSQMLEEWVWDADTLKKFAKDADGNVIPDTLIEKMNRGRNFAKGLFTRHQMYYAALSLNLYNNEPSDIELNKMMMELREVYSPFNYVPGTHFYASFGHLVGYSAIYYTYMWSLVIAADMFSEFEKAGLRNTEVAQRYRAAVLEPGGSKDAADLVKDFLGRPYSFKAFEEKLNRK